MKKAILVLVLAVLFAGCVAHVTPEGTYIEPLPAAIVIGPPVVVAPPPHIHPGHSACCGGAGQVCIFLRRFILLLGRTMVLR
jgi:hypothetical protein